MRITENVYVVRFSDDRRRWITRRDGVTRGIHATLQNAVEWAKAKAISEQRKVVWYDRDGNLQGGTSYTRGDGFGKALVHPRHGTWL